MLAHWTNHKANAIAAGDTLRKLDAEERSELSDTFLSKPLTNSVAGVSHLYTSSSKKTKTKVTGTLSKDLEAVASEASVSTLKEKAFQDKANRSVIEKSKKIGGGRPGRKLVAKKKRFAEDTVSEVEILERYRPGTAVKKHKGAISSVRSSVMSPDSMKKYQRRLDAGFGIKDMMRPNAKIQRAYRGVPFMRTFNCAHERPSHQLKDSCCNLNSYHNFSHQMTELGITNALRGKRDFFYVQPRHEIAATERPKRLWITEQRRRRSSSSRSPQVKIKKIIKYVHEEAPAPTAAPAPAP